MLLKVCVCHILEKPVSFNIFSKHFIHLIDEQNSLLLCKFRTTNHKLPIEKGRWSNIPRENRYCELCQKNQIGDEYHYIFECTNLSEKRTSLLSVQKYIIAFKQIE
jgi:hypothetical protein